MPGLFDNTGPYQGGGILSGLGNFFAGVAGQMNPAIQESNFRRQAYNALSQENGPQDAAVMMGNLPAYGLGFQRKLFMDQLNEYHNQNPKASLSQALYDLSPEGQKEKYGNPALAPGYEFGPYKAPGIIVNHQVVPPPGFPGAGPQPNAGIQGQPSQTPSQNSNLPPVAQSVIDYESQLEAAKKRAAEQGESSAKVDAGVDQVDRSIKLVDELSNHPGMRFATGIWANIPGGPPKGTQAYAFTKGVGQLKDQLTLDLMPTLQKMRTSPAVLEFLQKATGGQELDLGSPDFGKNLQDTRNTLVQIRAALQKGANVPVTEAPKAEGGAPVFKSQSDLRAAIKAGKIKVGQPFKTGDGRTLLAQ